MSRFAGHYEHVYDTEVAGTSPLLQQDSGFLTSDCRRYHSGTKARHHHGGCWRWIAPVLPLRSLRRWSRVVRCRARSCLLSQGWLPVCYRRKPIPWAYSAGAFPAHFWPQPRPAARCWCNRRCLRGTNEGNQSVLCGTACSILFYFFLQLLEFIPFLFEL